MNKGRIHIYTGDGKGKTTTAIGLSVRARSRGLKTLFVQFFKERDSESEITLLADSGIETLVFDRVKSPFFHPEIDKKEIMAEARKAMSELQKRMNERPPDLLVLDEFICLIHEGVLSEDNALSFIAAKPDHLEMVLTGNGTCESLCRRLIERADYVTYMKNVKHPYEKKIKARRGIEF